jgi:hypothetical protein
MPEKAEVMGYCKYPGGVSACIDNYNDAPSICGKCGYFTTDHPDLRKIMDDNPDFLEIL